ncbi:MAG: sulfatase [Bacteroidales bacterium]
MLLERKFGVNSFLTSLLFFPGAASCSLPENQSSEKPNFIIIFTDDLGYGDLGCYGSTIHETPNINKLSEYGTRFTDFYAASPVCTPSRASLLTGCYPQRVDMHVNEKPRDEFRAVLTPLSPKGLNPQEITIAEVLKTKGYATACIGKWHLGDQKPFWPEKHGFDYFYGILFSHNQGTEDCPLAIFEQDELVEFPVDIPMLTKKMTGKAVEFINKNADSPFFLYLPHPMPHFPLAASDEFKGSSSDGIYGDAISEIDWSVGVIMKELEKLDLVNNTMIVFTSDNGGEGRGGWVKGGLNHPLRGHKGQTWEGGMRVPCIIQWPGIVPSGKVCKELATEMDLLPTLAGIVGARDQLKNTIDGHDIYSLMKYPESEKSPYDVFYYYDRDQLQAIRWKNWKLHLKQEHGRYPAAWENYTESFPDFELYDLDRDPTETWNVAGDYPAVLDSILVYKDTAIEVLGDLNRQGSGIRKAGFVDSVYCIQEKY